MLESMMVAERSEFLRTLPSNKGNVYRPGHGYGHGCKLEFCIPRDRYANFHPQILAILRDQEEECDRLVGAIYTKRLTREQVGDVWDWCYPMVLSALTPLSDKKLLKPLHFFSFFSILSSMPSPACIRPLQG